MDLILYVGLVSAAFSAAWLLSSEDHPPLFWCAPFFVAVLAALMYFQKAMNVMRHGRYIKKIEDLFAHPALKGWEHTETPGRYDKWFMPVNVALDVYWIVLLGATFLFAAPHIGIFLPAQILKLISTH
ncbi:MAG: hypothetical protein JSS00_08980 [Proteobacteria bacterium]|nr:hypothetical protein [Pseudomonadota bacterium]